MERPRPKLVKVVPTGTIASKRARMAESVPGSHPAAVTATAPPLAACASRTPMVSTMRSWMSKLSTVL